MPILADWELPLDADKVLWGQGADPQVVRARRPRLHQIAEASIEEGRPLLAPAVYYEKFRVKELRHERLELEGGKRLAGPLIAERLARSESVIVAACTVGDRLTNHASAIFQEDAVRGMALDGLASAAAEALAEAVCQHFEAQAKAEGLQTTVPLNPGMVGWPLEEGQQQIFSIIDTTPIGVRLGHGALMTPIKSLSLVVGLGKDLDSQGATCDFCSMRETCRYGGQARG